MSVLTGSCSGAPAPARSQTPGPRSSASRGCNDDDNDSTDDDDDNDPPAGAGGDDEVVHHESMLVSELDRDGGAALGRGLAALPHYEVLNTATTAVLTTATAVR